MNYSDSDLERALFNLPLEETPDGLRSSILARTVYHRHALPVVKPWEAWLIGGCLAAIAQLPEKYRSVITLYHLQGKQYNEVAEVLGIPIGTVKTHLFRAKEQLRRLLNESATGARQ